MATNNLKSAAITNRDATPPVLSNANLVKGSLLEFVGKVEGLTTDDAASKHTFGSIPSNARVSQILLSCDAGSSGAMDVGIYQTTANGGAVVDVDFFASAQSLAAALSNVDVTHEADAADAGSGYGQSDTEKPLWQALGLTSDPGISYDICGTITTALGANATLVLKGRFAI